MPDLSEVLAPLYQTPEGFEKVSVALQTQTSTLYWARLQLGLLPLSDKARAAGYAMAEYEAELGGAMRFFMDEASKQIRG